MKYRDFFRFHPSPTYRCNRSLKFVLFAGNFLHGYNVCKKQPFLRRTNFANFQNWRKNSRSSPAFSRTIFVYSRIILEQTSSKEGEVTNTLGKENNFPEQPVNKPLNLEVEFKPQISSPGFSKGIFPGNVWPITVGVATKRVKC